MDRYQFEDLISDYLEGALSLAQRQEFESYCAEHPDCRQQVEDLRSLLSSLHRLPLVHTAPGFMDRLLERVAVERNRRPAPTNLAGQRTYFGFTPLYAGLLAAVLVAVVVVAVQLFNGPPGVVPLAPNVAVQQAEQPLAPAPNPVLPRTQENLARLENTADDSSATPKTLPERDLDQERMTLVKDQH